MASAASILAPIGRLVPRVARSRSGIGYTVYTAALFALFLVYTFPHDLVVRRVVDRVVGDSGWRVSYQSVSLVPWAGYRVEDLRVYSPGDSSDPELRVSRLSLRPSPQALLGKGFSVFAFHGRAYDGEFSGALDRSANPVVDLSWRNVDLGAYPELDILIDADWAGRLSGDLHLDGGDSLPAAEGRGAVQLRTVSLTQAGNAQGFRIPDLHFASGEGGFELKAGRLELGGFKLAGTEIDCEVRGQVYLRNPLVESVVNGSLTVRPIPGAGAAIEQLLVIANRNQRPPSGTFSYALYGTLNRIRVR